MIKKLVKHGRNRALIIDKTLLKVAGLKEDACFQVIINPNGGMIIQSVDEATDENFEKHQHELSLELFELMKSLSKR